MAEVVVEVLEAIEIADDETDWAVVAHSARHLALEPVDERAAVQQARERIVVREKPQLVHLLGADDRNAGLVREDAQGLELLARRQQPVLRLVRPQHPDDLALPVAQRDQQPVVVPRTRAYAVSLRGVDERVFGHPSLRLVVRQQEATLDLERRIEERLYVLEKDRAGYHVGEIPADRRARLQQAAETVDERSRHVLKAERIAHS